MIQERRERGGWGARNIDRLAADLREALADIKGFSPRNFKYMPAFAAAWPDRAFVQQPAAQMPSFHNCLLLDKLTTRVERAWYIQRIVEQGWSRNVLDLQIAGRAYRREGQDPTSFAGTLPPADSNPAATVFKDPSLFDFLGTADLRREREAVTVSRTQPQMASSVFKSELYTGRRPSRRCKSGVAR